MEDIFGTLISINPKTQVLQISYLGAQKFGVQSKLECFGREHNM